MSNSFAEMWASLGLDISNFSAGLTKAAAQAKRFSNYMKGEINDGLEAPAKKSSFAFKDVARIVQGIMISKAFYSGLNAIRRCTDAVWEFSQELEYAKMTYNNLFRDTALAEEFINVLEDFAAKTPFTFQQSEQAAKRLLAYGIQYKNVMYVMRGILAASSTQGNPYVIESVSRAMGQIYTKGRLMNEEMRQLAEAGIPAYEILQKKLGLTQEQLSNLGREGIPASEAINALVDGMVERFGGVVDASALTIRGLISNIKDNATMVVAGIMEPLVVKIKAVLYKIGTSLFELKDIFDKSGVGGVFEKLIPPELQSSMRQVVANLKVLGQAFARLAVSLGSLLKPVMLALVKLFNAFAPLLATVADALAFVISLVASNAKAMRILTTAIAAAAAMWVLFKLKALAAAAVSAVVNGISVALATLSKMLTLVVMHPFWSLLIGITGLVIGLSGGFSKLGTEIDKFFKSLTAFGGVDPDKILLPSQKERANDLEKFNHALDGTNDAMGDLADSTGKATKAAKGLLSFDEVFKLNKPDTGTDKGINPYGDIKIPDLSGLDGSTFMPKIPELAPLAESFVGNFIKSIKEKLAKAGIGAIIGGALGGLLGGPLGAKIGSVAGAIAGLFWDALATKLGVLNVQEISSAIGAAFTGAVAGLAHYITGSTLVTQLTASGDEIFAGFAHAVGHSFKDSLKLGLIGAITSLGVGLLTNALTAWIAKELALTDQDLKNSSIGQSVGNIAGTITGLILGGPMGSLVGGALGTLAGGIVAEFWEYMNNTLRGSIIGGVAGLPIGALVGALVGALGGPLGAALGAAIGAALGAVVGLIVDYWEPIKQFFSDAGTALGSFFTGVGQTLSSVTETIATSVSTWLAPVQNFLSLIGEGLSAFGSYVWDTLTTSFSTLTNVLTTIFSDLWTVFSTVFTDISTAIYTVMTDIWTAVTTVWNDISTAVTTVLTTVFNTVSNIFNLIKDIVVMAVTNIWNAVVAWFTPIAEEIARVCSAAWQAVTTWFTNIVSTIGTALSNIWQNLTVVFAAIYTYISDKVRAVYNTIYAVFNTIKAFISGIIVQIYEGIKGVFSNIYNTMTGKISSAYNTVKDVISNLYGVFTDFVSNMWNNVFSKLFGWIDDGISKLREYLGLDKEAASVPPPAPSPRGGGRSLSGHATGGIFNREHVARFAEGNKAEAVVPLENAAAMQPFVEAISNGLTASLMPMLAAVGGTSQAAPQPLYVGTLIADDSGLKELERKMRIIRIKEERRGG